MQAFTGERIFINGLSCVYNLPTGQNITVLPTYNYFEFSSTNQNLLNVENENIELDEFGNPFVAVEGTGMTTISATLSNVQAEGSLQLNVEGVFVNAPDPTVDPNQVISIYSDTYSNIDGFNPGVFGAENNGIISAISFDGNEHINYESINNFVGIGWDNTIDASGFTTIHLDIQLNSSTSGFRIELEDFGANQTDEPPFTPGSDDNSGGFIVTPQLIEGQWVGIDIPLSDFTLSTGGGGTGSPALTNLGYITLVSDSPTSILIDNIYFY